MPSVKIVWKGHCRSKEARSRLLAGLLKLARLSDGYLRPGERSFLSVVGNEKLEARGNIEIVDEVRKGRILVSSAIGPHPETLLARACEAGLDVLPGGDGRAALVVLDTLRLRGIDFKLFDPRGLYPDDDRMSFVFIEAPQHHFLDGRLVQIGTDGENTILTPPSVELQSYLEDWTDCLFSWIRFFLMGDLWWQRHEELQGYEDYRGVFEAVQTVRGSGEAELATFDAVLSTFTQHAEHWREESQRSA